MEYLGVMHWVSAEALARLPHTPPDKVDALLKADFGQAQAAAATFGLQQLVSGPGWPMLPSSATQLMIDADWLQWNAERGCYRCATCFCSPVWSLLHIAYIVPPYGMMRYVPCILHAVRPRA